MTRAPACMLVLACLLVFALPAAAARAGAETAEFVGLRVGFDDHYKAGVWTPVEVALRGGAQRQEGRIRLTVPDGDGVPSSVICPPEEPCVVMPGRTTTRRLFVRFGRVRSTLTAEWIVEGRIAARREFDASEEPGPARFPPAMPASQPLIVSVGESGLGVEDAARLRRAGPRQAGAVARLADAGPLPQRWFGYEGVAAVVLSTSRPETFQDLDPTGARLEALDRWVRLGGRLVLCVGRAGDEVLGPGAPLARFAPGALAEMVPLRRLGALEIYAGGTVPLPDPRPEEPLRVPRLEDVRGVVEAREADLPLVVRSARGFGQVLFLAADLDQPPLSQWPDRHLLLAKLLDLPASPPDETQHDFAVLHYAYDDVSGQLRSALDHFHGVRLVPFGLVAAAIVVYILLIGPGDYFLLKRVLRRMELTWITFPATVLIVCLAAYAAAYWLKGDTLRMNQADVVDVDVATGHVRGTAWFNLFSPRIDSFDLALTPQPPFGVEGPETVLAWQGLPGRALGGMSPHAQGPPLWTDAYRFTPDLNAMRETPIQAWSTKSFTARWQATAPKTLAAELTAVDGAAVGTVRNMLDVALTDCMLAYGTWAYRLGDLAPGQAVALTADAPRSELRTSLTGRRYVQDERAVRQVTAPYDRGSVDLEYILGTMLFYEAAGGSRYTGLANAYQPFVDMSYLLKTDRAILVARVEREGEPHRASAVVRGGEPIAGSDDRIVSLYRFVLPIEGPGMQP